MRCLADTDLIQFIDGSLPHELAIDLEAHLDGCGRCFDIIAALLRGHSEARRPHSAHLPEVLRGDDSELPSIGRRYLVSGIIGQGGMGQVYRAFDRLTGHEVALKRVVRRQAGSQLTGSTAAGRPDAYTSCLEREFRILATLRHPNIISVLDYGFDVKLQPFYTMELLAGARTILPFAHTLDPPARIALLIQLLHALSYLHRRGVLHRDIRSTIQRAVSRRWPRRGKNRGTTSAKTRSVQAVAGVVHSTLHAKAFAQPTLEMAETSMTLALITGSSRGLGKSMALHLAKRGHDVILTYHSKQAEADAVASEITAMGRKAAVLQLNVADSKTFPGFAAALKDVLAKTFSRSDFDALVNNAGTGLNRPFAETTEAEFDEMVAIHLKAPFFLTQILLPLLKDGGRIVNISSGLARIARPGSSAYGTMKAGLDHLTRYMAQELGKRQITAIALAPGATATDFGGGAIRDNPAINSAIAATVALGRVGQPDDIGGALAVLLEQDARWINGMRIEASGGQGL